MGDIVKKAVVESPVSKVYKYVLDPHNAPHYISSIIAIVSGPDGAPRKGDIWRAEANFFGQKRVLNLRLQDAVANKAVRFVLEGDPEAVLDLRLDPGSAPGSTAVSLTLDVPSVPGILLSAMLGGLLSADMARLKRGLETGA